MFLLLIETLEFQTWILWKIYIKKLDAWVGGANSFGGRLTLVNACLSSPPSYFMSLFLPCKTFFWRKWINTGIGFFGMGKS
jgi:hypothetical protein